MTPLHFLSDIKKKMVDDALVDMVIKDSQPFSIVEDVGFKELIHVLDPSYVLPSRQVTMMCIVCGLRIYCYLNMK